MNRAWRALGTGALLLPLASLMFACAGYNQAEPEWPGYPSEPGTSSPGPEPSRGTVRHTVRAGDTLYAIAREYGVTVESIQRANGIGSLIRPGQVLVIPGAAGSAGGEASARPGQGTTSPPPPEPQPSGEPRSLSPDVLSRGRTSALYWWPTDGTVASREAWRTRGLVILAPAGTPVVASAAGQVIEVVPSGRAPEPYWGNVVIIKHAGGYVTWYAHLEAVRVRSGQWVQRGAVLGQVGTSGRATSPQVAFRVFNSRGTPVDPISVLP